MIIFWTFFRNNAVNYCKLILRSQVDFSFFVNFLVLAEIGSVFFWEQVDN